MNERTALIKMHSSARELHHELENLIKGHGSRKDVAEAFIKLVSVAEKFCMSPEGRELHGALNKAASESHAG